MSTVDRVHVLCVDDEPNVLEGISLHLRRRFEVATATSGSAALEHLKRDGSTAVVLSDMRMPGMDGATFLSHARLLAPDTVRILLTGQTDLNTAVAAVNDGQIFRFLTKPCAPATLLSAVDAAAELNRLTVSERVLLNQTLHGSIKAMTEVLALTNPVAFGRATRVKQHVSALADKLGLLERWQVEVAAMLSQIGSIALPAETVEHLYYGQALTEDETAMVARMPVVVEQLLGHIPRLETVRTILAQRDKPFWQFEGAGADPESRLTTRGAQMLAVACDFDELEARGNSASLALDTLRGRKGRYDPAVLDAMVALRGGKTERSEIRELPISAVHVGMVFVDDVTLRNGTLVVGRGFEITASFIERIRNFAPGSVKEPVRVSLR
jgi:response regulator RpfG family c-di-GMP phosphodiesterase